MVGIRSAVTPLRPTAAQAIAAYAASVKVGAMDVVDSPGNIVANLAGLKTLQTAGKLASVTLSGVATGLTSAQVKSLVVLPGFSLTLGSTLAVSDSAANVLANLAVLKTLQTSGKLASVTISGAAIGLSVAQVISIVALPGLSFALGSTIAVRDSAAAIFANLAALQTLAANSRIAGIAFSSAGAPNLALTFAQYAQVTAAIAAFSGAYTLVISDAPSIQVAALQANGKVTSFTVRDTAANLSTNLTALSAVSKLTAILISDSQSLALDYTTQYSAGTRALGLLPIDYKLNITGASAGNVLALQTNTHVTTIAVIDTAANVRSAMSTLVNAGKLVSIALTNLGTSVLTFACSDYLAGAAVLARITTSYAVTISDSVSNVNANMSAMAVANAHLTKIVLTGTSAPFVLTSAEYLADAALLAKITTSYSVTIRDTSAAVSANVAALLAGSDITTGGISLTDGDRISVSYDNYLSFGTALMAKLDSAQNFKMNVTGAPLFGAVGVLSDRNVDGVAFSDTQANLIVSLATLLPLRSSYSITLTDLNPQISMSLGDYEIYKAVFYHMSPGSFRLTLTEVTSSDLGDTAPQNNSMVTGIEFTDSADNVAASLDALSSYGGALTIHINDGLPISISVAVYQTDQAAISAIDNLSSIIISDTAVNINAAIDNIYQNSVSISSIGITDNGILNLTLAEFFDANFYTSISGGLISVLDTAANISANLDALANSPVPPFSIVFTDGGTGQVDITSLQYTNDQSAISLFGTGNVQLVVSDASVAGAAILAGDSTVTSFSILDYGSAVTAAGVLDILESYGSKLASVRFADQYTPSVSLSYSEYLADSAAISKFVGDYHLTVTDASASAAAALLADERVAVFTVSDSATNILTNANALHNAWKIPSSGISITSGIITLDYARYNAYDLQIPGLISRLAPSTSNAFVVTSAPASAVAALHINALVSSFTVSDTAAHIKTAGYLSALNTAVIGSHQLTALTVTNGPLSLTSADYSLYSDLFGSPAIPGGYALDVTAAAISALSALQPNSHVRSIAVLDTDSSVGSNVAALVSASKVSSITVTGTAPINLTYPQYVALSGKFSGSGVLVVSDVPVSAAQDLQNATNVTGFSINDSAGHIAAALTALEQDSKITQIAFTDASPVLTVTASWYAASGFAKSVFAASPPVGYILTDTSTTQALSISSDVRSFSISDTAANVAAFIRSGGVGATNALLKSITITDKTTPMDLDYLTGYTAYASLIAKIVGGYSLHVTNAPAGAASTLQANVRVASFSVTDSPINITGNVVALNKASKIDAGGIRINPGQLTCTYAQYQANLALYSKIGSSASLVVTNAPASQSTALYTNQSISNFSISDSASNIGNYLGALNASISKITPSGISINSGVLSIDYGGFNSSYSSVFSKISNKNIRLTVNDAPVSAAGSLSTSVMSFTVSDFASNINNSISTFVAMTNLTALTSRGTNGPDTLDLRSATPNLKAITVHLGADTASVSAGLNKPSVTFLGQPDVLTVNATNATTVQYTMAAASGIEQINGFTYGVDILDINLNGAASTVLKAYDTVLAGGVHAVALYSSADPKHGVVLTGGSLANLASTGVDTDFLRDHVTFTNGHAIIT